MARNAKRPAPVESPLALPAIGSVWEHMLDTRVQVKVMEIRGPAWSQQVRWRLTDNTGEGVTDAKAFARRFTRLLTDSQNGNEDIG